MRLSVTVAILLIATTISSCGGANEDAAPSTTDLVIELAIETCDELGTPFDGALLSVPNSARQAAEAFGSTAEELRSFMQTVCGSSSTTRAPSSETSREARLYGLIGSKPIVQTFALDEKDVAMLGLMLCDEASRAGTAESFLASLRLEVGLTKLPQSYLNDDLYGVITQGLDTTGYCSSASARSAIAGAVQSIRSGTG